MQIETIERDVKFSRWIVVAIFGITVGIYFSWFGVFQQNELSAESSVWGAFGDFVGGLLNPLVAFSAFYWLTVSVLVQKQELAETRIALQDTSSAQLEQAELARKNGEVKVVNMKFELILSELKAEREYFNQVLSDSSHLNGHVAVHNKDGVKVTIKELAPICKKNISELEIKLNELILLADELTKKT